MMLLMIVLILAKTRIPGFLMSPHPQDVCMTQVSVLTRDGLRRLNKIMYANYLAHADTKLVFNMH